MERSADRINILGIVPSCDATAAAVVQNGTVLISNVIASQIDIHARYGGVVPEVASRQHLLAALPVVQRALAEAETSWEDLQSIAVTIGPGLAGSLLVGVNLAKTIALARRLPLFGINHLEGHIYANWLADDTKREPPRFPLVCLIVSGGHTDLLLMRDHGQYLPLGRTRDDAAGEAFDKVARILELGYPGGPSIQQAAQGASPTYRLPRAWLKGSDDFSFSGLKTAVLHLVQKANHPVAEVAASFQEAVVDVLVTKTVEAAHRHRAQQILLAGGVAANTLLRDTMSLRSSIPVLFPPPPLCTDNAAMIAACSYFHLMTRRSDGWDLDVQPNLKLV